MIFKILLMICVCTSVFAQSTLSRSISLTVFEDSLICRDACDTLSIHVNINNESNDDILVYGIDGEGIMRVSFELSRFCEAKDTGTGIAYGICSSEGKPLKYRIEILDYYGQRKVTKQMLDSALRVVENDFINSAIVLKKHEQRTFVKRLSLKDFELGKGTYYLQAVYYSGERISDVLNINEVTKKSKAKLFRGCAFSSKIPLIVE